MQVSPQSDDTTKSGGQSGNVVAERAVRVLSLFNEERTTITAAEVAEHLSMSRSTTYRYLQSLRQAGLLEENSERASFRLGPRIFELARYARRGLGLAEIATPMMQDCVKETGETVILTRRSGNHVICLEREESSSHLRLSFERGQVLPLHAGASALVLLAWLDSETQDELLADAPLEQFTEDTITDPAAVRTRLKEIRESGYALSIGERDPGVVGIAAPIFGVSGDVIAALSVVMPAHRFDHSRSSVMVDLVRRYAEEISDRHRFFHA